MKERNDRNGLKRLKRAFGASGLVIILATVLSACSLPAFGGYKGATTQGHDTHTLYAWLVIAAIVVGGITLILILWAVFRYRKKSDVIPKQFQYHIPLEITYTVIPVIIVLIVFFFTVNVENKVDAVIPNPYVKVKVTAFQWGWNFDYPQLHIDVHGVALQNPEMVLPTGETARITLVSADVVHGFYVRQFMPNRELQTYLT
jgi:cytochrome c oxidase subunit 2